MYNRKLIIVHFYWNTEYIINNLFVQTGIFPKVKGKEVKLRSVKGLLSPVTNSVPLQNFY